MKIGIDLLPLQSDPKRRGISNFVYNTIKELLELEHSHEYYFFNAKDVNLDFIENYSSDVKIIKEKITPNRSAELDIFLFTSFFDFERDFVEPGSLNCKVAIIVYDIIPVVLWENYIDFFPQKIKYEYFRRIAQIRECDRILTISQAVKKDLIEILEMPPDSIDVIYAGIDSKKEIAGDNLENFLNLKNKFQINEKYIFSVPSMDVRKNIFGLIEAYGFLPSVVSDDFQLVISNEMNSEFERKLREHAKKCNIPENKIIFTNYVSEEELILLYKNSSLFVFPSFNEGFGLPVLEAMHYGIPVITSDISSLPEVAGDAGILVNPYNSREIAREMERVLIDPVLQKEMSEKGKIQSKKFSWTKTAQLALNSCEQYFTSDPIIRLGMVTSWNVKCGIAEYSKYLIEDLSDIRVTVFANNDLNLVNEDGLNVVRCWDTGLAKYDNLYNAIIQKKIDFVHFQFNFGFYDISNLMQLKNKLQKLGIKVIITFHGTQNVKLGMKKISLQDFSKDLETLDKIIIHTDDDKKRLQNIGLEKNLVVIPHGIKKLVLPLEKERSNFNILGSPIIATFGFCLPHKGILECIDAIKILKNDYENITFLVISSIYPINESQMYFERCQEEVGKLGLSKNVIFFSEFLKDTQIFELLQKADLIVMPYKQTQESASGAVKLTLNALKPIILTDIPIFNEYNDEVYKIPCCSSDEIAKGIRILLENEKLRNKTINNINKKIFVESFNEVAQLHRNLVYN